jgi:hypothetical protein
MTAATGAASAERSLSLTFPPASNGASSNCQSGTNEAAARSASSGEIDSTPAEEVCALLAFSDGFRPAPFDISKSSGVDVTSSIAG